MLLLKICPFLIYFLQYNHLYFYLEETRKVLKVGSIPYLNFPIKTLPSTPKPERSFSSIEKRVMNNSLLSEKQPTNFYKNFNDLLCKIKPLKLAGWEKTITQQHILIAKNGN